MKSMNEEILRVAPTLVEFDPASIAAGNTYVVSTSHTVVIFHFRSA